MNRLWVWISAVVVAVVLFVTLFPFVYRSAAVQSGWIDTPRERIPFEERDADEFRKAIERRTWSNLSRTLLVGAGLALIAGVLLTRILVSPLHELEVGARAIAKRELDHRVPVKGSTEMRSVAESFNQMARELEIQEELRRNLVADVAHELRHPVHLLQGNLHAILDGVYPLNVVEINRLLEQTHTLTSLVDDLHELTLAEAYELPLNKQKMDINGIVGEYIDFFQSLTVQKGITLSAELPSKRVFCLIDAVRIRQALGNILSNALRFTPQNGEINIHLYDDERNVFIRVRDSGTGIASEDLSRVFDRFYRSDPSRDREVPGTGLGLAIAKATVEAHDGRITVESQGTNKGSTFTICLPLFNGIDVNSTEFKVSG
jgi:signal transduction histidine kinase